MNRHSRRFGLSLAHKVTIKQIIVGISSYPNKYLKELLPLLSWFKQCNPIPSTAFINKG